jgi:predicted DNA-binding protein
MATTPAERTTGTVTIRVPRETHERLLDLAARRGSKIGEVVDEATRRLANDDFWAEVDAEYERLWTDPQTAAELEAEQAVWNGTLADGLEDWPYEGIEELLEQAEARARGRIA